MIVVGADECVDGNERIAARAVFDDHRLSPALAEPVRQQPRADIRAASRPKRQEESDRPGRPLRCGRRPGGDGHDGNEAQSKGK